MCYRIDLTAKVVILPFQLRSHFRPLVARMNVITELINSLHCTNSDELSCVSKKEYLAPEHNAVNMAGEDCIEIDAYDKCVYSNCRHIDDYITRTEYITMEQRKNHHRTQFP